MIEIVGDLWTHHEAGEVVVITTNGAVRADGCAVMGRGVAREAALRMPWLPAQLGDRLLRWDNHVCFFGTINCLYVGVPIITFPVKTHWRDAADPGLIRRSAHELVAVITALGMEKVYSVRPGCGWGHLLWQDVESLLTPIWDDRFVIVEKN
mgnify:CR=1 FL=1